MSKAKKKCKIGPLSRTDIAYIKLHYMDDSVEEIAEHLNRRVEPVQEIIKACKQEKIIIEKELRVTLPPTSIEAEIDTETIDNILHCLHQAPFWKSLKDQFEPKELNIFEKYWVRMVNQFNNDVEFAEEIFLVEFIRLSLLIDRFMKQSYKATSYVRLKEQELYQLESKFGLPPYEDLETQTQYNMIQAEIATTEAALATRNSQYHNLLTKQESYGKQLKATREQRIEILKNGKKDWVGLMKQIRNERFRKSEGEELALMNLAADKERERLSKLHTYVDGSVDRPLLTPEAVEKSLAKEAEEIDMFSKLGINKMIAAEDDYDIDMAGIKIGEDNSYINPEYLNKD